MMATSIKFSEKFFGEKIESPAFPNARLSRESMFNNPDNGFYSSSPKFSVMYITPAIKPRANHRIPPTKLAVSIGFLLLVEQFVHSHKAAFLLDRNKATFLVKVLHPIGKD